MIGPYWVGDKPHDPVDVFILRGGEPVDLSDFDAARIELEGPAGVVLDTSSVGVLVSSDKVVISWPSDVSLFVLPGVYTMQILLKAGNTQEQRVSTISFEVRATADISNLTWATPSDVAMLTGMTVEPGVIVQAQGIVEMYSGAVHGDTVPTTRDLRYLRSAVAYQASFMATNEAIFSRAGVGSFSQDGAAFTAGTTNGETATDAFVLAPLARRALQAMQKTGNRTIRVGNQRRRGSLLALEDAWLRDQAGLSIWQELGTPPIDRRLR